MAIKRYISEAFDASEDTELAAYAAGGSVFAKLTGYSGELQVQSATSAVRKSSGESNAALYTSFSWPDGPVVEVVATIRPLSNTPLQPFALVCRGDLWGAETHYRAGWSGGYWYISKVVTGVETILAVAMGEINTLMAFQDYELRFQVEGDYKVLFVAGAPAVATDDNSLTERGEAGFFFGGGAYNDILLLDFILQDLGGPYAQIHDSSLLVRHQRRFDLLAGVSVALAASHDLQSRCLDLLATIDSSVVVRAQSRCDLVVVVSTAVLSSADTSSVAVTDRPTVADLSLLVRHQHPHDLQSCVRTLAARQDLVMAAFEGRRRRPVALDTFAGPVLGSNLVYHIGESGHGWSYYTGTLLDNAVVRVYAANKTGPSASGVAAIYGNYRRSVVLWDAAPAADNWSLEALLYAKYTSASTITLLAAFDPESGLGVGVRVGGGVAAFLRINAKVMGADIVVAAATVPALFALQSLRLVAGHDGWELFVDNQRIMTVADAAAKSGPLGLIFDETAGQSISMYAYIDRLVLRDYSPGSIGGVSATADIETAVRSYRSQVDSLCIVGLAVSSSGDLAAVVTTLLVSPSDLLGSVSAPYVSQGDLRNEILTEISSAADLSLAVDQAVTEDFDTRLLLWTEVVIAHDLQIKAMALLSRADLCATLTTSLQIASDTAVSISAPVAFSADLCSVVMSVFSASTDTVLLSSGRFASRARLSAEVVTLMRSGSDTLSAVVTQTVALSDILLKGSARLAAYDIEIQISTAMIARHDLATALSSLLALAFDLEAAVQGKISQAETRVDVASYREGDHDLRTFVSTPYSSQSDSAAALLTVVAFVVDLQVVISSPYRAAQDLAAGLGLPWAAASDLELQVLTLGRAALDLQAQVSSQQLFRADLLLRSEQALLAPFDLQVKALAKLIDHDLCADIKRVVSLLVDSGVVISERRLHMITTRQAPGSLPLQGLRGDTLRTPLLTRVDQQGAPRSLAGCLIDAVGHLADNTRIDLNPYLQRANASGRLRLVIPAAIASLWPEGVGSYDVTVTDESGAITTWISGPMGVIDA